MDYKEVTDYILTLQRKGFNIKVVTFDRWNSHDTMNFLESRGMETELLSVSNKHYDDFLSTMYDERLVGPRLPELIEELRQLRYMKSNTGQPKIDHPRAGFKDLSDAVCGAIFNAVSLTPKPQNKQVEIITYKSLKKKQREEEAEKLPDGIIRAPKRPMPREFEEEMGSISMDAIRLI